MALEKLEISREDKKDEYVKHFTAQFNPNQLSIQKSANWKQIPSSQRDAPRSQFTHGEPATLNLQFFLDSYEDGLSVRGSIELLEQLIMLKAGMHRPPLCRLKWGLFGGVQGEFFHGILQRLSQSYTLFLADGTPVRATVDCSFVEWRPEWEQTKKQSSDVEKIRTARAGDSLSSLAAEEYDDPGMWRPIAEANGIDDPLSMRPGASLAIPALTGRSS